jgi:hypothetical protein
VQPVTRSEIADHVEEVFEGGAVERDELVAAAIETGARPEAISTLQSLPARRYGALRQLWSDLPDLPVRA